jgi:replicative DNA helicase
MLGMATQTAQLRVPPQDIDAEKAFLGSVMIRPTGIHDVLDIVFEDSFYVEKHKIVWKAMQELAGKHEPIDLVTLSTKLKEKEQLNEVGGRTYLTELVNIVPSSSNLTHYAEVIARKAVLRDLIVASDELGELGFDEQNDIEDVLDRAEKRVFAVTQTARSKQKFISIKEVLPESWESMAKLHESSDELRGVPTGFKGLDNKLSGLMNSDLIILAARPSMGKTSLALDIARQAALDNNVPVGVFSLEMSAQQLVDRMLSAEAQVDSWKMRTGKALTDQDFEAVRDAMGRLNNAPIYIDDQPGNSILRMRSTARRLKAEHGLGLIIVDYLQLMTTSKNYDSMVNQVTEISRSLKALARELNVPVLALSQLSRAVEARGGKPRLSDLRDSGAIEQDADVVMFIHRDDKINPDSDKPGIAEILIEKHRNGPTGWVELFFDDRKTSFLDIEKTDFSDFGIPEEQPMHPGDPGQPDF